MSKKMDVVWEAPPHTIAKIVMLGSYMYVWFSVMGRTFSNRDLWYIDGFAGPGKYTNFDGSSPTATIKAAEAALQTSAWRAGKIRCLFVEEDEQRFEHLSEVVSGMKLDPRVVVQLHRGTFAEGIAWLKAQKLNPFSANTPLFSFIDPFGTRGLWFDVVRDLLSRPSCEVLINFDSDGVSRVLKAGDDANYEQNLDALFGSSDWKMKLNPAWGLTKLSREATSLYLQRLRSIPKVDYTFSFEMTSKRGLVNYHLVFAGQHPKGLEKMKEAMKKIDQTGEYTFCDANVDQLNLFGAANTDVYAESLFERFAGTSVNYSAIEMFALNESPFLNPKAMLKALESAGKIRVESSKLNRRHGTFPDDCAMTIHFGRNT